MMKMALGKEIDDDGANRYKFYFTREHNMVPLPNETEERVDTDFESYPYDYNVYAVRDDNVVYFSDIELCYPNQITRGKNVLEGDGKCCPENPTYFNYDTMEKNSILASTSGCLPYDADGFVPEPGDKVLFCTNPYFWTDTTGLIHMFDNVTVAKYTDFMGLGIVLEEDYDAKRMFQEYQVNEQFVNKVKSSIIPDFIDLEKVKFAPAYSGETIVLATGLTFNLHFRTRVMKNGSTYEFDPTWHLDDTLDTWNGNSSEPVKMQDLYTDPDFANSSNIMGYLGFTDDDVYNQKNRLKQSFVRLSFYDSDNPLEQNLLYYSTIFFDSGDLFGKFVKRKRVLEAEAIENGMIYDEASNPVVWSYPSKNDTVSAVTSQLIVNDEYDMTRSGEGFNLYLFKQDAPIENEEQDIYMKVEFNHAGYGRTVPLIYWRKKIDEYGHETDEPVKLDINNYLDNLYIPLKAKLTDNGYVYVFPDTREDRKNGIVWENNRLVFNLFEPKLELQGDTLPDVDTVNVKIAGKFKQE